jgi:hypothetical protein
VVKKVTKEIPVQRGQLVRQVQLVRKDLPELMEQMERLEKEACKANEAQLAQLAHKGLKDLQVQQEQLAQLHHCGLGRYRSGQKIFLAHAHQFLEFQC